MTDISSTFDDYRQRIDAAIYDYIQTLGGDETRLFNQDTFNGMITYVSSTALRGLKEGKSGSWSALDLDDIDTIGKTFDYYTIICSKYNAKPYLIQFCLFINISFCTFDRWINGLYKPSSDRISMCQRIKSTCELAQVTDSSIKSIFLLKSKYGYCEAPQQIQITADVRRPTEDLIAKYKEYPKIDME